MAVRCPISNGKIAKSMQKYTFTFSNWGRFWWKMVALFFFSFQLNENGYLFALDEIPNFYGKTHLQKNSRTNWKTKNWFGERLYATFSSYNGYLWTDFLNISFAHIDLNSCKHKARVRSWKIGVYALFCRVFCSDVMCVFNLGFFFSLFFFLSFLSFHFQFSFALLTTHAPTQLCDENEFSFQP